MLNRNVALQQIMPDEWEGVLLQAGFSKDGAANIIQMTQAVLDGKTGNEFNNPISLPTDFKTYLENIQGK